MAAGQSKLIGLLGGMSWESSALYYRLLNNAVHRRLGGYHNARSMLFTFDFDDLYSRAASGRWDELAEMLADAARRLEASGADFVMLTAVTAHAVADRVEAALRIPLLHLADPTAEAIRAAGFTRVGLLATRFTMEMGFLAQRLADRYGIEVMTPPEDQRAALHRIIVEELTVGKFEAASRARLVEMAGELGHRGAQAIIVGCTELPLLLDNDGYPLPAFDVTKLHAEAAIDLALS
ncbi:aspartate/glutamate racemase family protein [Mesorhizobium sp. CN2-181]|uniref:aspartate/glutamate racemase family protein n=1 Tax=Mesorhizobium yinganensis TaxID=3157707 RepID=UPI0032B81EF5